uniref:Uncharacterized protein n=1 Tax=Guillardia theta TaxID=55529 RepID=A0A7S4PD23_GUITH
MVLFAESAEQLVQNIARCLINVVNARIGYMDWMEDVKVVEMRPVKVDRDCYEKVLAHIPHESLSVSIILDAVLQQVAFSCNDGEGEQAKAFRVNEKNLGLIADVNDLLQDIPHRSKDGERREEAKDVVPWRDSRLARVEKGKKKRVSADALLQAEEKGGLFLKVADHFHLQEDQIADHLSHAVLPPHKTSEEARFRLLLLEFEAMLGIQEEEEKESRKIRKFRFVEELSKEMMQQQLANSLRQDVEPDVLLHRYPREDLLLVAFTSSCPASRRSTRSWTASAACHLGFWQWMQARNRLQASHLRSVAIASRRGRRKEEEARGEGEGEGEGGEKEDNEEVNAAIESLPLPDKPSVIYELDASRSLLFDRQDIVHMMNGRTAVRGEKKGCKYLRTTVGEHNIHIERMEEQEQEEQRCLPCSLKIVYGDDCCVWIRREEEAMLVDVSFRDGLFISFVNEEKVVQSRPHTYPSTGTMSWKGQHSHSSALLHSLEVHRAGFVVLKSCDGTAEVVMEDGVKGRYGDTEWRWTTMDGDVVRHRADKFDKLEPVKVGVTTDVDKGQRVCWMSDGSYVVLSETSADACLVHHSNGVEIEKKNQRLHARYPEFAAVCQDQQGRTADSPDGTRIHVSSELIEIIRNDATLLRVDKLSMKGKFVKLTRGGGAEQEKVPNSVEFDLSAGAMKQVDEFGEEYEISMAGESREDEDDDRTRTVLDVVRLFAMRRDGSGFELMHEAIAQQDLLNARMSNLLVIEEEDSKAGFGSICTIMRPRGRKESVGGQQSEMKFSCMSSLDIDLYQDEFVLWRQFQCREEVEREDLNKWREAMEAASEVVFLREGTGGEAASSSEEMKNLLSAIADHRKSTCQCEQIEQYVREKMALFAEHRHLHDPLFPVVTAPPAVFPKSSFRGVMKPSDPSILRPNYFSSEEGNKFLDSLGPAGRKKIVKEKRSWRRESTEEEIAEGDEEGEENNHFEVVHDDEQRSNTADSFRVNQLPTSGMHSMPAIMQQESSSFSEPFSRRVKTNYHLKHLRPAHYDILNRPRKHPIPDMTRHEADATVNEQYAVHELPVKRRTHTSSVLQKAMLDAARASQDITLDDMMTEASLTRVFRLRPRRANFGQLEIGKVYRFKLVLSNIGVELARYRIRQQTDNRNVRVVFNPGAVAAGMSVVLEIEINAVEEGRVMDEIVIETEKEVFSIPVSAVIISSKEFQDWIERGGQLPCNVAAADSNSKHVLRSKPPSLATLKREGTTTSKSKMFSESLRDLQDPVPEPQLSKYTTDKDWVVDPTRSLAEIRNLNQEQRMQLLTIQDMKRKGKIVTEEASREEKETKSEEASAE